MATVISILIILVCVLLILVVLVQNSKGGGLASTFASSNQVMGVRKTADFLEKATWTLISALVVLTLLSGMYNNDGVSKASQSVTRQQAEENGASALPTPSATPAVNANPTTDTTKK